jgi:hypothetical protein
MPPRRHAVPISIEVVGSLPHLNLPAARKGALIKVGAFALEAEKAGTPIQTRYPGGHPAGTLQGALTTRMMPGSLGIKIGVIGARSPGFFGRFVEFGHATKRLVGMTRRINKKTGLPVDAAIGRKAWKRVTVVSGPPVPPHPFFFPTERAIAAELPEVIMKSLTESVVQTRFDI